MTYLKTTHHRKGAVLIAVIGILAVLSLMAAVFGMLMSMERAAGRNQSEHEMARGAAQAAYEYVSQYLRSIPVATLSSGGAPVICPEPYNEFFSKELYRTDGVKVGFITAEPSQSPYYHANLIGKPWVTGLGTANAGMFDLNGNGHLADLGSEPDKNQRYSSLETSLTRLLKSRFEAMIAEKAAIQAAKGDDEHIWDTDFYPAFDTDYVRVAQLLATAIIAHRYGDDALPGTEAIEEHFPDHLPPTLFWPDYWTGADTGAPLHGDYWGVVGEDSAAATTLANDYFVDGDVSAVPAGPPYITLTDGSATWETNQYAGLVVAIYNGTGKNQWRYIVSNTGTVLTVARSWDTNLDTTSDYVIQRMNQPWISEFWNSEHVALMLSDFNSDMSSTNKGVFRQIAAANGNDILSLTTTAWTAAPQRGNYFCINRAGGGANQKIGGSDSVPTALLWPNGALSCERDVFPRAAYTGVVVDIPADNQIQIDQTGLSVVGKVIRILDGTGRGQVRRIDIVAGDILTLRDSGGTSTPWTISPVPTDTRGSGTISSYLAGGPTITVAGTPWQPGEHTGLVVLMTSGASLDQRRRIVSNSANVLTLASAFPIAIPPVATDTFTIVSQTYAIEQDYFDAGTTSAAAAMGANTLADSDKGYNWITDAYKGCVVSAADQTRLITANTASTLTLALNWRATVPNNASYRIEIPQDHKYHPDDLRGDDRVYRSVPEILPVMVDALMDDGLNSANAGKVAAILYEGHPDLATPVIGFSKDLTVSAASALDKTEYASINDTANDGIDNDNDGLIDEADEDWSADKQKQADYLFDKLGLREWAGGKDPEILQAAQIVVNIMDSRDEDDVPTTLSTIGGKILTATVYGYEGVHITEVMATPPKVYSTLTDLTAASELIDDGGLGGTDIPVVPPPNTGDNDNTDPGTADIMQATYGLPVGYILNQRPDLDGWDWNNTADASGAPGYWEVVDPTNAANRIRGEWEFGGLLDGWYAIRLRGGDGSILDFKDLDATDPWAASVSVTTNRSEDPAGVAEYWGYVRSGGRLVAVHVSGGKLKFEITADQGATFYGFQLLPQYIEITNCAAHDVHLNAVTFNTITLDAVTPNPSYTFNLGRGAVLPGAAADGVYPIRYGTFILAMSEDAYDHQWGGDAVITNAGAWQSNAQENYPVFFIGDLSDDDADRMLLTPTSPTITVRSNAKVIASTGPSAGNPLDGSIGTCTDYVAKEKINTPFSRADWEDYAGTEVGTALAGSQNKPAGSGCLNQQYYTHTSPAIPTIWNTYPTIANPLPANRVWPLILNRPFPSPGWLGLVLTGHDDWRTIDPDPTPHNPPTTDNPPDNAEELLGTLMSRALVGGVHARLNLNHPIADTRAHVFKAAFSDADATSIETARALTDGWINWDHLLNTAAVRDIIAITGREDSGAGTFADDYPDDPDEKEEWARRYSNVVDLKTSNFKYVLAGMVYAHDANAGDRPLAIVRIEVDFAIDGTDLKVVNFRYVMD